MVPALAALLTEALMIRHYTGQDAYGKPTYGAAQTYPAREEFRIRKILDQAGQERISRAKVFFDRNVSIGLRDQVTLSDGTVPPILAVYAVRDTAGALHHSEVFFG